MSSGASTANHNADIVAGNGLQPDEPSCQLKNSDQLNEQRRLFLNNTIKEETADLSQSQLSATTTTAAADDSNLAASPNELPLKVKYATMPGPVTGTAVVARSPPPKPPMLGRTRSIGSGDARTPGSPLSAANGKAGSNETSMRHSISATTAVNVPVEEPVVQTISAKHYEGLIEELRCPGCAGAMKAPVLLCKSGHSVCEQCTRILLMCPLCKEPFTRSRSLTVEALCAKAHFRCSHSAGGCTVRMPVSLLPWHEMHCIYKPMKCFMGRVWGDCSWNGREIQWKQHLDEQHADKVFKTSSVDLVWNVSLAARRKPLTGYYVFQAHDEMFNFYEIHDKQRVLFTMTCTSNRRDIKYNYAYEVTLLQPDNEALSMTQKFPVHSEYDRDILMDGTCVSIGLGELARFVDEEKQLHYHVNIVTVKMPVHRPRPAQLSLPREPAPIDYQQTQFSGVNGKSVPTSMIITRTYREAMSSNGSSVATVEAGTAAADVPAASEFELERKWGTPQLHFNRKYLKNAAGEEAEPTGELDELAPLTVDRQQLDDKLSLCSNSTSYARKFSNTFRKSFRTFKTDIVELRPFSKKPSEKSNGK